ncbi:MAG: hypothetical protein IJ398_01760 [Clostridia bacterium]|nr:hypothetical protein [Clostridia bacterium]
MFKRYVFIFLTLIVAISSVGGVYATWLYAESPPISVNQGVGVSISEFNYPPEEILPGGGEGTGGVEIGQDHYHTIQLIVDEAGKGYSLNSSGSILHSLLRNNEVVYSNQKVSGGNLKFILDPSNNTHKLYYALERVSDTLYYAYTFSIDELSTAGGTDIEIVAYRTSIEYTDKWYATESHMGYAKTASLRELGASADPKAVPYSIVVSDWHLHA